jgi:hypothetical protein
MTYSRFKKKKKIFVKPKAYIILQNSLSIIKGCHLGWQSDSSGSAFLEAWGPEFKPSTARINEWINK